MFNKLNFIDLVYIKRNNGFLCVFIDDEGFLKFIVWNRNFFCRINIFSMFVCFFDIMVIDVGVFNFVVGNV